MTEEDDDGFQSSRFVVRYFDRHVYSSGINLSVVFAVVKTNDRMNAIIEEIDSF